MKRKIILSLVSIIISGLTCASAGYRNLNDSDTNQKHQSEATSETEAQSQMETEKKKEENNTQPLTSQNAEQIDSKTSNTETSTSDNTQSRSNDNSGSKNTQNKTSDSYPVSSEQKQDTQKNDEKEENQSLPAETAENVSKNDLPIHYDYDTGNCGILYDSESEANAAAEARFNDFSDPEKYVSSYVVYSTYDKWTISYYYAYY